jgi:hypothetical protein
MSKDGNHRYDMTLKSNRTEGKYKYRYAYTGLKEIKEIKN